MQYAFVNTGDATTDNELVAAPGAGYKVVVRKYDISSDTDATVTFESGGSTVVSGQHVGARGGKVAPADGHPWFECAENESLTITTSAGAAMVTIGYSIERV